MSGIRFQEWHGMTTAAAAGVAAALLLATPVAAQTVDNAQALTIAAPEAPAASWYVVGDIEHAEGGGVEGFAGFDDRLVIGNEARRAVGLGLTFSNAEANRTLSFTAPSPVLQGDGEDRFTFLVSGAYDWHTGTIVTPRFMAGVGVSYLDPNTVPTRLRSEDAPGSDIAPAMQVGIGADVAISSSLDLSAEYRASVRGAAETGGVEQNPQLDQKFMIGAKLRF